MDIIVDIDGTLCELPAAHASIMSGLGGTDSKDPMVWNIYHKGCENHTPILPTIQAVRGLGIYSTNLLLFCTNRPERFRKPTLAFLGKHFPRIFARRLYMRRDDEYDASEVVKERLYNQMLADGYKPVIAFEDQTRIVKLWRSKGIITFQVADGDF